MKSKATRTITLVSMLGLTLAASSLMTACSSSGSGSSRTYTHPSAGYRGYYRRPWGYRPIYVGGGGGRYEDIDPDFGVEAPAPPIAVPLPELGMPDFGGGMDFGDYDW